LTQGRAKTRKNFPGDTAGFVQIYNQLASRKRPQKHPSGLMKKLVQIESGGHSLESSGEIFEELQANQEGGQDKTDVISKVMQLGMREHWLSMWQT